MRLVGLRAAETNTLLRAGHGSTRSRRRWAGQGRDLRKKRRAHRAVIRRGCPDRRAGLRGHEPGGDLAQTSPWCSTTTNEHSATTKQPGVERRSSHLAMVGPMDPACAMRARGRAGARAPAMASRGAAMDRFATASRPGHPGDALENLGYLLGPIDAQPRGPDQIPPRPRLPGRCWYMRSPAGQGLRGREKSPPSSTRGAFDPRAVWRGQIGRTQLQLVFGDALGNGRADKVWPSPPRCSRPGIERF